MSLNEVEPLVEEVTAEVKPEERLAEVAKDLKEGRPIPPTTVKAFLGWFGGAQRRRPRIVSTIRGALNAQHLITNPDFESAYIDAELTFESSPSVVGSDREVQPTYPTASEEPPLEQAVDPTYRISRLFSADLAKVHRELISVSPDSPLSCAVTLMMANDFSQVPVMTSPREVKGVVSWKSVGTRLALGKAPEFCREAMDPHQVVSSDASLFTTIPVIIEHEYALVKWPDKRIAGIITASDLCLQFQQLSEPFLLIGEIENHIRVFLNSHFSLEDLQKARDSREAAEPVVSASDLTFGEYKRFLEDPSHWSGLGLKLDRTVFIDLLEKVRITRNDVMHFDSDGIADNELDVLREFAKFLRSLQAMGVL